MSEATGSRPAVAHDDPRRWLGTSSLLDLEDRPPEYEQVGRLCAWDGLFPPAQLGRSRYERVVIRAVSGQPLRMDGRTLRPVGMSGWSAIVFQRDDASREVIAIDDLIERLEDWERA